MAKKIRKAAGKRTHELIKKFKWVHGGKTASQEKAFATKGSDVRRATAKYMKRVKKSLGSRGYRNSLIGGH